MENFYLYLTKIGFELPREVPPLGTANFAGGAFLSPGPIYWSQLTISEKSIDDPRSAQSAYARYAFPTLLGADNPANLSRGLSWDHRIRASWVCEKYFISSFNDKEPSLSPGNGIDNWVGALWDIRKACHKAFTDSALFYALKSFDDEGGRNPQQENKPFDEYFAGTFTMGVSVVDNNGRNLATINAILRGRKLIP